MRLETWDDKLFKRLAAARLDNTIDAEIRRLIQVQLLINDDFALQPLDANETADFYELAMAQQRKSATVITSNRDPSEWLAMMADPLLAQSPHRPGLHHRARTVIERPVLPAPARARQPHQRRVS